MNSRFTLGVCVCVFTLILCPGAERGLLQVFQQERLEDFRAAMESSQDVQQPPASLATITARNARVHRYTQDYRLEEERGACVCVRWFVVCTLVMYSSRLTVWSWC